MGPELGVTAAPSAAMEPSAALVAFSDLLALPSLGLEARVQQELAENPALEWREAPTCRTCGEAPRACGCLLCETPGRWEGARWPDVAQAGLHGDAEVLGRLAWLPSDAEELLAEAAPQVAGDDRPILDYLVGNLDTHGRLHVRAEEVATALGVELGRVGRVLEVLRRAGPPGVAARDARECLLQQLERW
jgi:RNA polymerase sigma-54 factor